MGSCHLIDEELGKKKPRVLCLHGYRTSGEIMSSQVKKWPAHLIDRLDLVFPDAPHPAQGRSEVEGLFPPPYYEWFQFTEGYKEYSNHRECLDYIGEYMVKHGPFDGLMGFSQGAILSAALVGLQSKGLALNKVRAIKFVVLISGAKFHGDDNIAKEAYSPPLNIPSVHFLGEKDSVRPKGVELLKAYVDPFVIHHSKGHTIPRLDDKGEKILMDFINKIENLDVEIIHPIDPMTEKSDIQSPVDRAIIEKSDKIIAILEEATSLLPM